MLLERALKVLGAGVDVACCLVAGSVTASSRHASRRPSEAASDGARRIDWARTDEFRAAIASHHQRLDHGQRVRPRWRHREAQEIETGAPPLAGRKEWIGLGVLTLACLLYAMDLTVLHLAVPSLSADLEPTSAQLLWIVDIYGFMVAGCLITMGTLGDRIGRRRLLMIGAASFGAVSVLAAFSTSAEMLIASRALQGIAGATLAPSTLSLIFSMFKNLRQRSVAIGVWIAGFSAGGAIGPVLGGVLLEHFWWGSVFLLAVPVMALLLVLGPRLLPEYRDPDAARWISRARRCRSSRSSP